MQRLWALGLAMVLAASPGWAQTGATGSVVGTARDESGAVVPGVSVSATSDTAPGVHAATTDRLGRYELVDLPPGGYRIEAELSGFSRVVREPVVVRAGLSVAVDLALKIGGVDETVEVRQETPLLESRSATQSVNISGDLLRSIPLLERREWYGALSLAPGVTTADFAGQKMIYVHGADQAANIVQVDGADVGSASRAGVYYLNLNTQAIDDMQIKTAGVDASAPLGIGGIISIATASGTNRWRGDVGAAFQPRRWNGSNLPGGTSTTSDERQVDLSGGGPLVKDHLWTFASYRYNDITTGVSRTAAQLATLAALQPGYRPLDSINTAHFWLAKLTAQPSSAHQVSGFVQRDVNPADSYTATSVNPLRLANGGSAASARLSSIWSDRLTTRASVAYNDKRRDAPDTGVAGPFELAYQSTIPSSGLLLGNGMLANLGAPTNGWVTQPNQKLTFTFDASLYLRRGAGSHELQAGLFAQRRIQGNDVIYVNDGFDFEESVLRPGGTLQAFHRQYVDGTTLTAFRQRGMDYAGYIQDAWRPTGRVTVNAGVRVDHVVMTDLVFDARTQNSTDVGPRLGVNYLLTADGRNVARAHWVRVHDQPGIVASVGRASLATRDAYDLNLDGSFETTFVTPATFATIPNQVVDPGLHQPSIREWGAGYSKQLPGGMSASVDVVHRVYLDRPTQVEINGKYDGQVFAGYKDESFNQIYLGTNNSWNSPVYDDVEASMTKRTARLEAIASYARQWRHLDGSWQPNDPASFIQPDAFRNDKGIGSATGTASAPTDANSLSGSNMTGRATGSAQWLDHAVRTGVTYNGSWGLLVSASYTFQSGIWSGPIISRAAAPDPAFGPPTVRLSNGRVVSNPLATTFRFAYSTRGDGQLKTPSLHALNLRVGRRFATKRMKFDASLDIFNVTNNGADLSFDTGSNQTFNPLYGTTTFRQSPRSAQVVLHASF